MKSEYEEIDLKTVLEQRFAAGQGVVTLSASMTDEQILTLIKGACIWSKGKAFQVIAPQSVIPEEIDAQMRPYRDLGRAVLPQALATAIDTLKVRDKLLQALGAIERTDSVAQAEVVSSRATTYALSARDHDGDLSISDWHALDTHIRKRIAAKQVGDDMKEQAKQTD